MRVTRKCAASLIWPAGQRLHTADLAQLTFINLQNQHAIQAVVTAGKMVMAFYCLLRTLTLVDATSAFYYVSRWTVAENKSKNAKT